jgi:hypothetical protein
VVDGDDATRVPPVLGELAAARPNRDDGLAGEVVGVGEVPDDLLDVRRHDWRMIMSGRLGGAGRIRTSLTGKWSGRDGVT